MKTYIIELTRRQGFSPKPNIKIEIRASSQGAAIQKSATHTTGYVFYRVVGVK